ncbi:site-specific integrase [Rhizobium sp. AG855]|uniref:tyrosine-type recombinase/integrase n=1 Tax=Rhizobium sp. AG855 TaxID=2183898 RepID=UPI000E76E45A|nr:site-specific integrase [Rhizobium sp. AG855]RKE79913.1 site-specific recombinase XerD [Rhizobium sp. AG855]
MNASVDNAKIIYLYQGELKHTKGFHPKTIDDILRHIWQFEKHTESTDFRSVTRKMIEDFKDDWISRADKSGKGGLSASTIVHTFGHLKAFFEWLAVQDGYRRSITAQLYNHFNSPMYLSELASAAAPKFVPAPEQIRLMLDGMPTQHLAHRRDRAMIAALFLFGVRDGALISLCIKHVDIDQKRVFQDAREVKTKFSKTSIVDWFPVGEDIERIIIDWITELKAMGASEDDPLIPTAPFKPWIGRQRIELEFLTTAAPVRRVVQKAAAAAGVPRFKPHAIRSTVAKHCDELAGSMRDFKVISQNFGHEQISTTTKYYGEVDPDTKQALFKKMRARLNSPDAGDILDDIEQAGPETLDLIRAVLKHASIRQ